MWQALRDELHPRRLEIVTIAVDAGGAATAGPWIERAQARHPSLIDTQHLVGALFGVVNVPSGIWIDEEGTIVRPAEPAHPWRPAFKDREIPRDATPELRERIETVRALHVEPERYVAALRDWVAHGSRSRFALSPSEVVRRSRPRPLPEATAPAHFAIGQALHAMGEHDGAIEHFRAAQELDPTNWTYRRDAWSLAEAEHERIYGTTWLDEVKREGVERYYPPLDMPE